MDSSPESNQIKFLYDLRQRRAKLIGDQIDFVALISRGQNYFDWYKSIEQLYTFSKHAFKEKERENIEKEYRRIKDELINSSKKHNSVWQGHNRTPEGCEVIEEKLRELTSFVLLQIEEAKLFGTSFQTDYEGI
jgi:hypothetical protein